MTPTKKTKLVCGIGVNDADYVVRPRIDGKIVCCPFYKAWVSMLVRCYSQKFHANRPTYIGCSVSEEWLTFSNFKSWMETQDWEGKQLDKDVLRPGNKVYGPDSCVFVAIQINNLLNDHSAKRGLYPAGVCFRKSTCKFIAAISKCGQIHHIGVYTTPEEASAAYVSAKVAHIIEVAQDQAPNIKAGLLMHAELM